MITDYVRIFELENTNIIYDGIKRLWEQLLSGKREQIEIEKEISRIKIECGKKNEYLAQNIMADFFRFLGYSPRKRLEPTQAKALAGMVLLYGKVKEMEEKHIQMGDNKSYLENYSEMCAYLRMIALGMDSYLVHVRDSRNIILASSTEGHDDSTLEFIYGLKKGEKFSYGDTVSYYSSDEEGEKNRLIIKLLLSRQKNEKYKQTVYIVFAGNMAITNDQYMRIARNVLFLRQEIQILLERDLYALHHFKISYEDVKPLSKDGTCRILHISDLHVDTENCKAIKDKIADIEFGVEDTEKHKSFPIDLIVITGDVAQGKSTALDMEENYKKAEEVIRCLAYKVWGDFRNKKDVRFDWKKRIVIIPGNHDYASMNELLVVNRNRATFNGEPAREEGSPMIKYTYYIDFLRRLLDLDITNIIRQNLNEYRVYPWYSLELVCFNTIAEVSMLRNNKVQIDREFQKSLPHEKEEGYIGIYLMHHTPLYVEKDMDYNRDKYGYKNIDESLYGMLAVIAESYGNQKDKNIDWNEIGKGLRSISPEGKKTDIYRDIEYLYNHRGDETNERCNQIVGEYQKNENMCKKDKEVYAERLEKYLKKIWPNAILGGHTHQKRNEKYKAKNTAKEIDCYETGKFYDKKSADYLDYGILTITRKQNKRSISYTSYDTRDRYNKSRKIL